MGESRVESVNCEMECCVRGENWNGEMIVSQFRGNFDYRLARNRYFNIDRNLFRKNVNIVAQFHFRKKKLMILFVHIFRSSFKK